MGHDRGSGCSFNCDLDQLSQKVIAGPETICRMKDFLSALLEDAGRIQLEKFTLSHEIRHKESISSIVTEVDLLCDRKITAAISSRFSGHSIISEEGGMQTGNTEYTWVIDPLDGTSNYAAGIPWLGVLIALFRNEKPVLAGAYLPVEEKMFLAEEGGGAYLNSERISIPDRDMKDQLMGFSSDFTEDEGFLDSGMELYRFLLKNSRNIRSTNSLVDHLLVAEGKLGGTVGLFNKIWDVSAPYLIITEAGGEMRDISGKPVKFFPDGESLDLNYPVIAGSPAVVRELTSRLS